MRVQMIIGILLLTASATDVDVSNQCTCEKLLSEADCKSLKGCNWFATTSLCSKLDLGANSTEGYCGLISDATTCAKTKGCAYVDSVCQIFAGCTAYKGATDAECQAISKFCNSDGEAFCVDPGLCTTYKTSEDCVSKGSSGGSGTCVWDSSCRDQKCSEADPTLNTDAQCNNFIEKCVTTGKGCISTLGLCSTYSGDIESCEGMIGSDGYCKGVDGKDKCEFKACTDADTTLTTDAGCAKYQIGCVTNGYGCVKAPLGLCSTQTGDDVICSNKIGSDGKCKGTTEGKTCSAVECKDAPETYSTNDECKKFKTGCVTTGKGCISQLGNCSSYKGTSTTCDGYVGTDGKCKGTSDAEALCSVKVCKDAEATLDTDEKCEEYQTGCKTTGKGCVSTLSNCSSYTGDSTSCDGYIGIDGKCTGGTSSGSCFPKKCSDAASTLITNQECSDFQTFCISTGTGGCMDAGTCSSLSNKSQCDGKSKCSWSPQCVQNVICQDLKSESLCNTVSLQDNKTCWWVASNCVERTCDKAPTTYDSDQKCDTFLKGCLTKKKGCVSSTATCNSYEGTKTTCEGFTIKCTNIDNATETTTCKDPVCSDKTNGTTDEACKSFYYGCVTNGTSCVSISVTCDTYLGTSIEICSKFKGNNQQNPCWWQSGPKCVNRVCTDADDTYTTDDKCESFLKGCITTGAGCVQSSDDCQSYTGLNQISCLTLSTGCARREKCTVELTCAQITNATSQTYCDDILPNQCIFIKNACVALGNCNTYSGASVDECKDLLNSSGIKCYWTSSNKCTDRECAQIKSPQNLKVCTDHKSTCAIKTGGSECQEFSCNLAGTPNPATEETCQLYHTECHLGYVSGQAVCTLALACNSYGPSNTASCSTLIALKGQTCKSGQIQTDNCLPAECGNFHTKETECKAAKVALAAANQKPGTGQYQFCFYDSLSQCVERSCNNAKQHLGGTVTSFDQCNKYFEQCVLSKPSAGALCVDGYVDTNNFGCKKLEGTQDDCLTLKGKYKLSETVYEYRLCQKHDQDGVANCVDRTCDQKTDGYTDAICQTWLPTCKTNGVSCVDISTSCTLLEGTSDSCKLLTGLVFGSKCQSNNTSVKGACVARRCQDNGTAKTDADCKKFLKGCITTGNGCVDENTPCSALQGNQDICKILTGNSKLCWSLSLTTKGSCIDRTCAHNTTAKTNTECETFMKGCVTKNPGCIEETAECTSYQGVQADCEKFIGNGKTCTNDATATATTTCKVKDCTKLSADTYSQSVCQAYGIQCHYNGSKCDVAQSCSSLKGNLVTCTQYVATNGPCIGTALQTETPTSCSSAKCTDAPSTLVTDTQCEAYQKGCKTTGQGCASSITCGDVQSSSICSTVKIDDDFICTWASQCRDIESSCNNFTSSGSSVCTSSKTTSGFGICIWKDSVCTEAKCEDLPLSVSSEIDCTTYSTTCTFGGTGNGCATKGACTTYKKKEICANAKSTDTMGSCAWDESIVIGTQIKGCRVKECQDAATTLINDSDCNSFIEGCVSNGAGCMKPIFTCDMLKSQAKCIKDSLLRPCLWINNACRQYYNCTDLSLTTVSACQAVSKYCTTDENKCTPLKICANYTKQSQCTIGTDGSCGWVTNTKKCQLFTQCADLVSKVNTECQAYNPKCISNGTNCVEKGECSTYADSEAACTIGGTDGTCYFDNDTTACRLRQCSDASTSTSTHNGCFSYQINATTKCTTNESKCISLADCQSYTKQGGCVIDTQLKACTWDNMAKACKSKTCSDTKKTKSSECASALVGCISDGTKCIEKGKCSDYSTKEACSAGGTDGVCVFSPTSGSATTGVCKLFTQCSDANSDQIACQSMSQTCKWTVAIGTTPSSCANHTCDTAAKGTAKCVTIPSFDGKKYTVCQPQGGKCVVGDPSSLIQDNCYKMSQYTYSWNAQSKKCIACGAGSSTNNNSTSVNNNIDNTTNTTTDDHGQYLYVLPILISFIF